MDPETRDTLREQAQRRAISCPYCGSTSVHLLTEAEKQRRDDLFAELAYKTCGGCGQTWRVKSPRS